VIKEIDFHELLKANPIFETLSNFHLRIEKTRNWRCKNVFT